MLNKSFSCSTTINLPFFIPTSTDFFFFPLSDLRIILRVLFILFLNRRYLPHLLFALTRACLPFSFFPLESHLHFLLPLQKSTSVFPDSTVVISVAVTASVLRVCVCVCVWFCFGFWLLWLV